MKLQNHRPRPNPTADAQSCGFAELIQLTILALAFVLAASGCTTTSTRGDATAGPHPFRNNGNYAAAGDVPRVHPPRYRPTNPSPAVSTADDSTTNSSTGSAGSTDPVASDAVTISAGNPADDGGNDAEANPDSDTLAGNLLSNPDDAPGPIAPNPAVASGPGVFDAGPAGDGEPETNPAVAGSVKMAREVPLVALSQKPNSRHIIIIDPGHGGRDPGGSGNGLTEKTLALDVSNRLVPMLRKAGFTVKMTRTGDTYPTLPDRITFSKRNRGWVYVSIHANAFTKPESRGVETLFPSRGSQSRSSRTFANLLQKEMVDLCPTVNRGAKADVRNLYLMRNAHCPLALVEMGFMTNEEDAAYLAEEGWRESIAHALYNGIIRYYNANR